MRTRSVILWSGTVTLALTPFVAAPARGDVRPVVAKEDVARLPAPVAKLYFDTTLFPQPAKWRDKIPWVLALGDEDTMPRPKKDLLLFDFEEADDLKSWKNLEVEDAKVQESAARLERSTENATLGKHSLKITFAGGAWPTVATTSVAADWSAWPTFEADVTVGRECVVGFTVWQERSQRGEGYEAAMSRWTRTIFLKEGKNQISSALRPAVGNAMDPKRGNVVGFEVFMYNPHEGESIYLDNVWLSVTKAEEPPGNQTFTVAGTDWVLDGVNSSGVLSAGAVMELGKKLDPSWKTVEDSTVAQLEEEFAAQYAELKKTHPRAVLTILRDGENGYDPAAPDKTYADWKDAYFSSHGPDGIYRMRAENRGRAETQEIFMRHRSPLMRVDLSSIPTGSQILAARLLVVRATEDRDPRKNPTMWVVEPCNRPWDEDEVNTFQYAKDKFWKDVGGFHWTDDPDFLPVFLAYGPGRAKVNSWDFTEAVRFWTGGEHTNHGFMLHGDSRDYMNGFTREAKVIKNRPAVLVIYEPK